MDFEAAPDESSRNWHRLFGLVLTSHLAGSPFAVELEKELAIKRQYLDVVVVRRGPGELTCLLPDGLDDFVDYNLITFKSHREPLDDWTLKELTGHYVNYRKLVSPRGNLLSEERFQLYAVCARQPRALFAGVSVETLAAGVYACRRGTDVIRIVVAAELPKSERNALLHLFSAAPDRVQYGAQHYRLREPDTNTIVYELFKQYGMEGLTMPYTMEDFRKEFTSKFLADLTPDERLRVLRDLTPEERQHVLRDLTLEERQHVLRDLTLEERQHVLRDLTLEERQHVLRDLTPEERLRDLTPKERLHGLSAKQIEDHLRRLRKQHPARKPKAKSKDGQN